MASTPPNALGRAAWRGLGALSVLALALPLFTGDSPAQAHAAQEAPAGSGSGWGFLLGEGVRREFHGAGVRIAYAYDGATWNFTLRPLAPGMPPLLRCTQNGVDAESSGVPAQGCEFTAPTWQGEGPARIAFRHENTFYEGFFLVDNNATHGVIPSPAMLALGEGAEGVRLELWGGHAALTGIAHDSSIRARFGFVDENTHWLVVDDGEVDELAGHSRFTCISVGGRTGAEAHARVGVGRIGSTRWDTYVDASAMPAGVGRCTLERHEWTEGRTTRAEVSASVGPGAGWRATLRGGAACNAASLTPWSSPTLRHACGVDVANPGAGLKATLFGAYLENVGDDALRPRLQEWRAVEAYLRTSACAAYATAYPLAAALLGPDPLARTCGGLG